MGAGHWAQTAHIPSFQACGRIEAICDVNRELAKKTAAKFGIPKVCDDYHELVNLVDVIDVCSSAKSHHEIALESIRQKKPVLCEKPLAMNLEEARDLWIKAKENGVKTKMGFTFRYSPALRRMKELIAEGFIGEPYLINGFEQNSQFIDPKTPFRWSPSGTPEVIMPGSLEEYAPHLIDIALWMFGNVRQIVGNMKNFVPERLIRDRSETMSINIEDASVWLAEFENGAQGTFQSSFVAVGNYPGVEVRVFGSKGAIIAKLVEERGVNETLMTATPSKPQFSDTEIPSRLYGEGKKSDSWITLYFRNLARAFVSDIIANRESEADFLAGVKVQEVEDAVFLSHRERKWVSLPLP